MFVRRVAAAIPTALKRNLIVVHVNCIAKEGLSYGWYYSQDPKTRSRRSES